MRRVFSFIKYKLKERTKFMTQFNFDLNQKIRKQFEEQQFQNVFDYPDFIEMRPILRESVRQVAQESFNQPVLPVKVERMTTSLEEQMERETRKYQRQGGFYENQRKEKNNLARLFTHILQVISAREEIDQEVEDIIYAVDQTRLSINKLRKLPGEGKLYEDDHDRELIPGTYYYLVAEFLVRPYLIDSQGKMVPKNVKSAGKKLVLQMTTYAYRDWDAYLTHQYDEQHNIKNRKGLTDLEYYDLLEENELKYADHAYSEVLADSFSQLEKILVPKYCDHLQIMSTNLEALFKKNPLLRMQFNRIIMTNFKVDAQGKEHVMDAPLKDIRQKYNFYRKNFI